MGYELYMSDTEKCTESEFFQNGQYCMLGTREFEEYEIGMHYHEFYEINIVLGGCGIHFIENNMYKIKKGDAFVIPPGIYHGYKNSGGLEVYHILVSTKYIARYSADLENIGSYLRLFNIDPVVRSNTEYSFFLTLDASELEFIQRQKDMLEEIKARYYEKSSQNCNLMMNSMGLVIIESLCQFYESHNTSSKENSSKEHKRISNSIQFICDNYDKKITLKMLADNINMSASAYSKLFVKVFKASPMQYVISYRLSKAKSLLENTDITVTEIAQKTGFYDSAHLNKIFIANEGMCPNDYRRIRKSS